MKIIEPFFEFIDVADPLKKIEICGRVCYKSESKITDGSAETFVKNLINRGHESVLEHVVFIVQCDDTDVKTFGRIHNDIFNNGGRVLLKSTKERRNIISGNVRMWRDFMRACDTLHIYPKFLTLFDGVLFDDVNPLHGHMLTRARFIDKSELTPAERDAHFTQTVKFVVDRGISHEIVRHRTASFSQESTRYCNYSGDITFIKPPFFDETCMKLWINEMKNVENLYNLLISKGAKPQEARAVLPNSTKTELIMTANVECWKHFFDLRTPAAAHPQMKQIAEPLKAAFIERSIL